jgi:Negative regulator of sigma F
MTDRDADDLRALGLLQALLPPPAPSPALLASIGAMQPVRTRVPFRTLLVVAAAACVFPVVAIALYPLRRDLGALPPLWLGSVALAWLAGFVVPLAVAMLPPRGQVLPDGARAARTALLASLTLVLMGLLFTVDAPGVTILPKTKWAGFFHLWWHCVSFSLKVTVPAVVTAAVLLRKVAVASLVRLGAAVGAAGGALSGLTLHGLCPYGGAPHVGLAHGGGVVIGALLGALWLPILVRAGRNL